LLGDRYRALQPMSQGGIGRTFLGVDEQKAAKPRCVIKQLPPKNQGTDNVEEAAKLSRQAAACLQLGQHPQIPELLAYFEPDSLLGNGSAPTLVQSLIEGESLAQKLQAEGALSETQIRQILNELAAVLEFVHAQGVIHRDINPENIIRSDKEDQLVLVDFGAAKFTTKTALARTGTTIGSAAYAAPEQLRGKAFPASDLYSLGVTCIHLLTHIHPFDLFNSLEGIWVWQDYLINPVSNELTAILNKMLADAASQRYQSAQAILNDLNPQGMPASTVVNTTPAPKSIIPTWHCLRTLTGHLSSIHAVTFSPDGQSLASASADRTVKLRSLNSTLTPCTFTGHSSLVAAVAFSPDGQFLVSGSWDHTIKFWRVDTLALHRTLYGHSGWIHSLVISPDGTLLASGSADKTIKIWDLSTGEVKATLKGHDSAIHTVTINPDGTLLASGSADKTIKIWNLTTGEVQATLCGHADTVNSLVFSPGGQLLISGSGDKTIKLWHLNSSQLLTTLTGHTEAVRSVAISAQGSLLISGSADNTLKLWHPGSQELLYTLTGHTAGLTSVAISPDGSMLASGSQDQTIKIWQFE
jgi:WD40 repeat protein/tRNA A-37 threonylcarbamoyl transferase component Bud32